MANYNVGNIEIGVISSTKGALNNIDKVIAKLQEFNKIDKNIQSIFNSINKLANAFVKLGKINVDNLKNNISQISSVVKSLNDSLSSVKFDENFIENSKAINQLANALNKLQKLENLNKIDFATLKNSLKQLANAIDPFLKKIEKSKDTLSYLSNILNTLSTSGITRATNELNRADKTATKLKSKLSNLFNIGKIYFLYNYSRRIIQGMSKMVTYASDYIEILNKFRVSFGALYEDNLKLTNQLAQAFGFSTNTLMDYTATFNNMLKGLKGLSDELSAEISQILTKMAIDYSSLFNVSLERSMNAFQSAIAGNIRTLRSISGFDVSEITIFSLYQELGGTKTMRQLNQLEKRLLRIIAIQRQMEATGALGDYGRTIETVSNQVKILKENLIEVGKWIGMNLLVYIKPVIQYANAILIVIKEMSKSLANLKEQTNDINYEEEFAGFGSSVEEATESVEELENALNSLLGFDTLNILGNTSTANLTEGLSVEGTILNALREYNMNLENVKYKAKDVSESILTWLGYTKVLNEETNEWEWRLQDGFTNVEKIKASILTIATTLASIKISTSLQALLSANNKNNLLNSFKGIKSLLNPTTLIITAIVGLLAYMYASNEDFKASINGLIKSLGSVLLPIINFIVDIVKSLMPTINMIIDTLIVTLVPLIENLIPVIQMIAQVIGSIMTLSSSVIGDVLKSVNDILSVLMPILNILIAIANFLIGNVLVAVQTALAVIDGVIQAIFGIWKTLYETVFAILKTLVALFTGNTDKIGEIWGQLGEKLKGIWGNIWKSIKVTFIGIINSIIKVFAQMVNAITKQINKLTSSLSEIWTWAGIPAIPQIPEWTPSLIPLASGGVIKQPTHALVGEYAGAKSNPEIVTPENLMRKVFVESMLPIAQAIINGNQSVVGAIDDLASRPIELDGRRLSEGLYGYLNKVSIRKNGKPLGAK